MKFAPGVVSLWETAPHDSSSLAYAIPAASAAAGIGSAIIGSGAASDAAAAGTAAANRSADISQANYGQTRADLAPYRDFGQFATGGFGAALPWLTSPTSMTQADLEQTPGYQFALSQGLKGVQNSASARGLGVSGAAMKGAAGFATGLADNTYQTQFGLDQTNKGNSFNRLYQAAGLGENAAAGTGNLGQQAVNSTTNALTSGANTAASGIIGGANAMAGGLGSASNSAMSYLLMNKLYGGSGPQYSQLDPNQSGNATLVGNRYNF